MRNRFSSMAFIAIEPVLQAIYNHPFIVELVDGTLPHEKFVYYLQQDRLFLAGHSRALALTGAKMHDDADSDLMLELAHEVIQAERDVHDFYFDEYRVPNSDVRSPACLAYCSHILLRAAIGTQAEALSTLLACLWIDREIGNHVRRLSDLDNPYFRWIESYSGERYSRLVDQAVELTDRKASDAGEEEAEKIFETFVISGRYEYCFWDDAYHLRPWPI